MKKPFIAIAIVAILYVAFTSFSKGPYGEISYRACEGYPDSEGWLEDKDGQSVYLKNTSFLKTITFTILVKRHAEWTAYNKEWDEDRDDFETYTLKPRSEYQLIGCSNIVLKESRKDLYKYVYKIVGEVDGDGKDIPKVNEK